MPLASPTRSIFKFSKCRRIEHAGSTGHKVQTIQSANYAPATSPAVSSVSIFINVALFFIFRGSRRLPELLHLGLRLDIRLDRDRDRAVLTLVVVVVAAGRSFKRAPPFPSVFWFKDSAQYNIYIFLRRNQNNGWVKRKGKLVQNNG